DSSNAAEFPLPSADAPTTDVWHGEEHGYGPIGEPQPYYNTQGPASDPDGVAPLSYTLNGGEPTSLSMGPERRRLAELGDFNVDLAEQDLVAGDNEVAITAVDELGNSGTTTVTVEYVDQVWPDEYAIDWTA